MKDARAGSWLGTLGSLLAVAVPKGLCPLCLATSGSVVSTLGLSFLADSAIMQWVLAAFLAIGLLALLLSARRQQRWLPFWLAVVGSIAVYAGWFFKADVSLYAGMVLLVAASILNLRKRRIEPLVQIRLRKEPHHGNP